MGGAARGTSGAVDAKEPGHGAAAAGAAGRRGRRRNATTIAGNDAVQSVAGVDTLRASDGVAQFARLRHRREFSHTVNSVSLSGDAQRVAGGDAKGDVAVYDFSAECEIFTWRDTNQARPVAFYVPLCLPQ